MSGEVAGRVPVDVAEPLQYRKHVDRGRELDPLVAVGVERAGQLAVAHSPVTEEDVEVATTVELRCAAYGLAHPSPTVAHWAAGTGGDGVTAPGVRPVTSERRVGHSACTWGSAIAWGDAEAAATMSARARSET